MAPTNGNVIQLKIVYAKAFGTWRSTKLYVDVIGMSPC